MAQHLTRRELLAGAAASHSLPTSAFAQAAARPNVIVIVADDMGFGDLGANGAADARTPVMDQLASGGMRFTDWHATSPVCSPSRASLLTGKYPQHAGVPRILPSPPTWDQPGLRAGETTLATVLRQAGYRTAAIGKWHLGSAPHSRPVAQGFDYFFGFYSGWIDYYSHRYYSLAPRQGLNPIMHDLWRNDTEVFEEPLHQTDLLAREARAFLARQSPGQPFFLYLAFGAPHYPMIAHPRHRERFAASMDRDRREHLAMVAGIDDAIGELLAELDRRGLDNTILFFQSDNGATREERADHQGRAYRGGSNGPFRAYKGSLFEGGHRVPAWVHWKGRIRPGQVVSEPLMAMDLMPTLASLAGRPAPPGVDGIDLSRLWLEGVAPPERTLYWEHAGQRAIRRGPWKLIEKPNEGLGTPQRAETWLSDLQEDAPERQNHRLAHPGRAAELEEALRAWRWPRTP